MVSWCCNEVGAVVVATQPLDPEGAAVRTGTAGVVVREAGFFGDDAGPLVRWSNMGICNIYQGQAVRVDKGLPGGW